MSHSLAAKCRNCIFCGKLTCERETERCYGTVLSTDELSYVVEGTFNGMFVRREFNSYKEAKSVYDTYKLDDKVLIRAHTIDKGGR